MHSLTPEGDRRAAEAPPAPAGVREDLHHEVRAEGRCRCSRERAVRLRRDAGPAARAEVRGRPRRHDREGGGAHRGEAGVDGARGQGGHDGGHGEAAGRVAQDALAPGNAAAEVDALLPLFRQHHFTEMWEAARCPSAEGSAGARAHRSPLLPLRQALQAVRVHRRVRVEVRGGGGHSGSGRRSSAWSRCSRSVQWVTGSPIGQPRKRAIAAPELGGRAHVGDVALRDAPSLPLSGGGGSPGCRARPRSAVR
jgi:hypothetical protein